MQADLQATTNAFGQPVGLPVPDWKPLPLPSLEPMAGRFCRLEPYDAQRHLGDLHATYQEDDGRMWTYVPWGPFAEPAALDQLYRYTAEQRGFQRLVIVDAASGRAVGEASYMRQEPELGSIEVGAVAFGPRLKRMPAATEAMHLMMKRAFETGYRRYEWKCDALNAPSRAAALRLGFVFEGIFRQERVYRGRNRDTAWFSVVDHEWPAVRQGAEQWLEAANFDGEGRQRRRLAELIAEARQAPHAA
jgi:RimJ/RimL family protein N-acetyltransferase